MQQKLMRVTHCEGSPADASGSFGNSSVPARLSVPQPERPASNLKTEDSRSPPRQRHGPRGGAAASRWSKLLRGGATGDWTLSENKVRQLLAMEGAFSSAPLSHVDMARGMVCLHHSLLEKMRYYRRRSGVLHAKVRRTATPPEWDRGATVAEALRTLSVMPRKPAAQQADSHQRLTRVRKLLPGPLTCTAMCCPM